MIWAKDIWEIVKDQREWQATKDLAAKVPGLERRIAALEAKLKGAAGDHVCAHCGSPNLKRTWTRPSATPFSGLGVKDAVFLCLDCNGETRIEIPL